MVLINYFKTTNKKQKHTITIKLFNTPFINLNTTIFP